MFRPVKPSPAIRPGVGIAFPFEDAWLVEANSGECWIEAHGQVIPVPADEVRRADGGVANLVAAYVHAARVEDELTRKRRECFEVVAHDEALTVAFVSAWRAVAA